MSREPKHSHNNSQHITLIKHELNNQYGISHKTLDFETYPNTVFVGGIKDVTHAFPNAIIFNNEKES